ncbi:MAG: tRNA epoxyqueuosine(34) reductase QueG, partial [Gemmatimonadales bacterium]
MTLTTLTAGEIRRRAEEMGFLAAGITDLSPNAHADRLDDWLARGYGGTMRYLHRQAARRKEPARIAEGARSVVVLLDNYHNPEPAAPGALKVAQYARGHDYHTAMTERIERIAEFLREAGATLAKVQVDAGPVPERELAARAGLGWIGKNAMLIRPGVGSFFFIGTIFTDLELPPGAPYEMDRCGSCSRCLDACPTDAFPEPGVVDATRCISYLTIEYRGPVPEEFADRMEGWAFGCDICNDVCPWNAKFAVPASTPAY